jgi:hypothetical protein
MITAKEFDFLKARELFDQMCQFVQQAGEHGERIDQVERGLFPNAMAMCLQMLSSFVAAHGDGDEGESIARGESTVQRLPKAHEKRYLSVFGELLIERRVYGTREGQAIEWVPLDAALGLPSGENSYVLEDWLERLCVKEAYGEAVEDLRAWLGTTVSVRTAEGINRKLASYCEGFRLQQGIPTAQEDEEILVVSADGKGVPMRRPLQQRLREEGIVSKTAGAAVPPPLVQEANTTRRLGKKQMAYVGAVYSIAPFVRTAEEVVDEVCRRQRSPDRPRPVSKRLRAQMTSIHEGEVWPATPLLFLDMAVECQRRDPKHKKTWVCLMDGERQFWDLQQEWFRRAIGILDLFHAIQRLWDVAYCVHKQQSPEARSFVTHHLEMLLQGQVVYVIRNFRTLIKQHDLKGSQKETVESAITYYGHNREHMRYHEYLAAGYPIASGVIEGACHHFVKDRMEGAGMRWELEGAQAMLSLRAIYLNEQWNDLIEYRIIKEQTALYGEHSQPVVAA